MGTPEHPDLASGLLDGLSRDATAAQVADRLGALCVTIDIMLSPILGRRGVAALMHRSLRVASATHPWLSEPHDGMPSSFDVAALTGAIGQQDAGDARASAVALMRTFHALLASLIGTALTARLLMPIVVASASVPSVPGPIE